MKPFFASVSTVRVAECEVWRELFHWVAGLTSAGRVYLQVKSILPPHHSIPDTVNLVHTCIAHVWGWIHVGCTLYLWPCWRTHPTLFWYQQTRNSNLPFMRKVYVWIQFLKGNETSLEVGIFLIDSLFSFSMFGLVEGNASIVSCQDKYRLWYTSTSVQELVITSKFSKPQPHFL